jgi:hypothetical protein
MSQLHNSLIHIEPKRADKCCCRYTDAHSNPDEVTDKPDLAGLSTDFDTVKTIRNGFVG